MGCSVLCKARVNVRGNRNEQTCSGINKSKTSLDALPKIDARRDGKQYLFMWPKWVLLGSTGSYEYFICCVIYAFIDLSLCYTTVSYV